MVDKLSLVELRHALSVQRDQREGLSGVFRQTSNDRLRDALEDRTKIILDGIKAWDKLDATSKLIFFGQLKALAIFYEELEERFVDEETCNA